MALKFSFDPLSGRLDVGFEDGPARDTSVPPPRVTPKTAQTVPKPSPEGGSAPNSEQPKELIKPYYLRGEKIPEGVQTKLERVDIDGQKKLARVPILPSLTPEQQARVDEAANAQKFTYGYDPKSGEFLTGVVPTGINEPLVEDKAAFDKREGASPVDLTPINNPVEAAKSAARLTPLANRKIELGFALSKANADKNVSEILRIQKEIDKVQAQYNQEASRRGNLDSTESLLGSLSDLVSGDLTRTLTGANNLATATTLILGESLGPMISQIPGQITSIIDASEGKKPLDAEMVGSMVPYYYGMGAADQYTNSYEKLKETYGDSLDTIPLGTGTGLQKDRLILSSLGQSAVDVVLGKVASLAGGLVLKPLKASSIVGKNVGAKTLRRTLGITSAIAGGSSTEGAQEYLNQWGNAVDLGFLDVLDDPERRDAVTQSAVVGGILGFNLASIPAGIGTARDISSVVYDKIRGRKPSPVVIIKTEDGKTEVRPKTTPDSTAGAGSEAPVVDTGKSVTGMNNLDTSDLEVEVEDTSPAPVVEKPKKVATPKVTTPKVEPKTPEAVSEGTPPKPSDATPTIPAYDVWNEYYNSKVEAFEQTQDTPRTPGEIYQRGTELGLPVGDIYTKIVGDETTPVDAGTPQVQVANNIIKSVVEAAEAQTFYTDLGKSPEAQDLYLDAVAASKDNPERQAKIKKVKAAVPSVPEVVLDTLPNQELDAIAEKVPEPTPVQEIAEDVKEVVTAAVVPPAPPAPVPEVTEAVKAITDRGASPVEQVREMDKPVETIATPDGLAYDESKDPLAIPSFLDRRAKKPLLAGDRKATYQPGELVDVEYTGVFLPGTPLEVREALTPFIDNLKAISQKIGSTVVGKGLSRDVDLKIVGEVVPVKMAEDGSLVRDRAEGEYRSEHNAISLSASSLIDQMMEKGNVSLDKTQAFLTTAVHEYIHAADMNGYFGDRNDNVFNKSIKDMQGWLEKNTEYGDLMSSLDPVNSRADRAEVIAYYVQNYVEKSNSKAATEFRRLFNIPKSPDTKGKPFLEPQGGLKLWVQKAVDTFRRILEVIKARLAGLRDVNKVVDEFFSGEFAKQADAQYLDALQRQTKALYESKARGQSLFAMKDANGLLKKDVNPIDEALRNIKRQAKNTQEAYGNYEDYIKDPNSTYGFGTPYIAKASFMRNLGAQARFDKDFAHVLNLGVAVDRDKTELLRTFGPIIEWIQSVPNYEKYMQIMLDLRKQDIKLESDREDGGLVYTNRKNKKVLLPKQHVDIIKEITRAFSVPMNAIVDVTRARLRNLNSRPNFDIPFDGTVGDMKAWLTGAEKRYKDATVKDKEDRVYLDRAKAYISTIEQIDGYIKGDKAYVPELRKGSWAFKVTDLEGNQIGLYPIETVGGFLSYAKPNRDIITQARLEILKRYRGRSDVIVAQEPFELTRNQLAKDANAGKADLHLLMSLLGQAIQGELGTKLKGQGVSSLDLADMVGKSAQSIADGIKNASNAGGFQGRFLKSKHIDGASENWPWVLDTFFSSAASTITYMKHMDVIDKTRSAYKEKAESSTPLGFKAKRLLGDLDYMMNPAYDAPTIRAFSYLYGLAFRVSTALIQTTPLLNMVPGDMISLGVPMTRAYGSLRGAIKYASTFVFNNNIGTYLQSKSFFNDKVLDKLMNYFGKDVELRAYARDALAKDTVFLNAALVEEALGDIRNKLKYSGKGIRRKYDIGKDGFMRAGGFLMNLMERSSRTGTYLAYLKEFHGHPDRIKLALSVLEKEPNFVEFRRFNPEMDDVRAITNYSLQLSFGMAEKAARPRYTRGPVGAVVSPFVGIPSQMYETQMQNFMGIRGKRGVKGAIVGLSTMALMFGAKAALPTFFIFAPALMEIFGEPDEPGDFQIKQAIVDLLGVKYIAEHLGVSQKEVVDTILGGMTYQAAGIDISSRVGNALPFSSLVAEMAVKLRRGELPTLDDLTGIVGSTASSVPQAVGQVASGRLDALEGASLMLPAFMKDILKATNMATGDTIRSASGKPLLDTSELTTGDIIAQALGFAPKKVQDAQLRNRIVSIATSFKDSDKAYYKNRFVRLGVAIQKETDPSRRFELKQEYVNLRRQFFDIVKEIKETDPERYNAFFGPKKVNDLFDDVEKDIKKTLNPRSSEGLSENAKNKLDKTKGLIE